MLNRVCLIGRLVSDPELRKSNSDVSFATFTIAVDNAAKEADGTRGTCFLDGRVFGTQADNLVKYTRKGDRVAIDGSLNQRNFIRQDGSKGKSIEVIVDSVTFLEVKKEEEPVNQEPKPEPQPKYDPMTGKPLKPSKKQVIIKLESG